MTLSCPHGMPNPAACIDCMAGGPVTEPPTWHKIGAFPFLAKHDSECPTCLDRITSGETYVQRYDYGDERTVYVHPTCPPPPHRAKGTEPWPTAT